MSENTMQRVDFRTALERFRAAAEAYAPTETRPEPDQRAVRIRRDENGRSYVELPKPDVQHGFPAETPHVELDGKVAVALGYDRGRVAFPANGVAHLTGPRALAVAYRLACDLARHKERLPVGYVSAAAFPSEFGDKLDARIERTLFIGDVASYIGRGRLHHVAELLLGTHSSKRAVVLVGDPVPPLGAERHAEWQRIEEILTRFAARRITV